MRMRRRRSRRRLAIGAAAAYLCLVAGLLSPLWRSAAGETAPGASMRPAPAGRPLGALSLGRVDAVPSGLPGYTPPEEASRTVGGEAEVSQAEGSEFEPVEAGSESASAGAGGGGSGQPAPSGGSSSEEQSIIGFEG